MKPESSESARLRTALRGRVCGCVIDGAVEESRTGAAIGSMKMLHLRLVLLFLVPAVPASATPTHVPDRGSYHAALAPVTPVVDGVADDEVWRRADWHPIDQLWLGPEYTPDDFQGRFKLAWNEERLFILVEVVDDVLFDSHRSPFVQYWDDDCLEIFIDEDHSGGDHQFNHNAFAYHMSLDNQAIDIGTDREARDYSDHVASKWRASGSTITWELAIKVFSDTYVDGAVDNEPVTLRAGKIMGLMIAWCDNDGSEIRENFIGSESVPFGPKDRGWIDAGLFGTLELEGGI